MVYSMLEIGEKPAIFLLRENDGLLKL